LFYESNNWIKELTKISYPGFCDILKTGGLPGRNVGMQPHLYFANDDLEYQVG
jgi:hypothetical protein